MKAWETSPPGTRPWEAPGVLGSLYDCRKFKSFCGGRGWCRTLLSFVYHTSGGDDVHGFGHVVRVACLAFNIAWEEYGRDVDWALLAAAALLHDTGRSLERLGVHHAVASARLAEVLLPAIGAPVNPKEAAKTILEHSYSLAGKPSTPESCSLSDADKLDALGVVGFYRLAYMSAVLGRTMRDALDHYHSKLSKLPSLMCTGTARRLAEKLHEQLEKLVEELREATTAADQLQELALGEDSSRTTHNRA